MVLALFNDIGGGELLIVGVVALLLFGKNLPIVSRKAGRIIAEFKRGIAEASVEINREMRDAADVMEKAKQDSIASADISKQIYDIDKTISSDTNPATNEPPVCHAPLNADEPQPKRECRS